MKGKFFIGAAVGFVGGVAAFGWALKKAGYSLSAVKRAMMERVVRKVLGDGYKIEACAVSDYSNWLRRTSRNAYGYSGKTNDGEYLNYARYVPEKPVDNPKDKTFELVRIFGKDALLCTDRSVLLHAICDTRMTPWFNYDLRGSDNDPEMPATVELFPVHVNYCGAIITKEELIFPKNGDGSDCYIELKSGDLQCCGAMVSAESFMKGNYDVWEDCWYDWNEDLEEDENEEEGDDEEE